MPHVWPKDTDFALWELDVLDRDCPACGRMMHICDHRYRHFFTLDGPVELVCKLNHCPDPRCPGHARTRSPEVEPTIALPGWGIAWDVFCWIGHRRFARHWSIPQIRGELHDAFAIDLTEPGIANYVRRYQAMPQPGRAMVGSTSGLQVRAWPGQRGSGQWLSLQTSSTGPSSVKKWR